MALDGITIANLRKELSEALAGGRITKIAQPEPDELLLTIKNNGKQHRLSLSASPSLPLTYLSDHNKTSPLTAPNFCMLLRKHLQNGKILTISQPGLERVLEFEIEHADEMGDLCRKRLIVEMMGKHSNIIFATTDGTIIDSIKHIPSSVSSVREVLPGRPYFIPRTQDKAEPLTTDREAFFFRVFQRVQPVYKAIYSSYTGLSPTISQEICFRAGMDADRPASSASPMERDRLWQAFRGLMDEVGQGHFTPCVVYAGMWQGKPVLKDYAAVLLTSYDEGHRREYTSICRLLADYYEEKNQTERIHQRSYDLRRTVSTALERNVKKYDLQLKQLKDTEKRDTFRVYGELLHTYGYSAPSGARSLTVPNYYTNEDLTIPLDPTRTALENAAHYFEKYQKLKRTYEALTTLTLDTKAEIEHLESISNALDIAQREEDLAQIREELIDTGYIRRRGTPKKSRIPSRPFHYISSDGFDIYVGKNNYQNDELTFRLSDGNDWWFHAKGIPGSHVVLRSGGKEVPDRAYEEAAKLAGYYSRGKGQDKVEIDYTLKKNVKKPNGSKPGFVVYYTNYSMMTDTDISGLRQAAEP